MNPASWFLPIHGVGPLDRDTLVLLGAAVVLLTLSSAGIVWWSQRRLTGIVTPSSRQRWYRRIDTRGDGFEIEAVASWWGALHDGLLGGSVGRLAARYEYLDARLDAADTDTRTARRRLDALEQRVTPEPVAVLDHAGDHGLSAVAGTALGFGCAAADLAIVRPAISVVTNLGSPLDWGVALPLAAGMYLGGRQLGAGIARRQWVRATSGGGVAIAIAALVTIIALRVPSAPTKPGDTVGTSALPALPPSARFALALVPVTVATLIGGLVQSGPTMSERLALTHARRRHQRMRRRSDRLRAEVRAARARLGSEAFARLVARPHAGLDSTTPPLHPLDGIAFLGEAGVIERPISPTDPADNRKDHE